jgi:hypothetical protein
MLIDEKKKLNLFVILEGDQRLASVVSHLQKAIYFSTAFLLALSGV